MADNVIDTVVKLANLATSDNEGEANNAARKACTLIRANESLFKAAQTADLDLATAQANVHPDVRAHFAVQKLIYDDWLELRTALFPGRCAACGGPYKQGTEILVREHLSTHATDRCKPWWFDKKPVSAEEPKADDELPF